jgi:hypothetical protein
MITHILPTLVLLPGSVFVVLLAVSGGGQSDQNVGSSYFCYHEKLYAASLEVPANLWGWK